MQAALELAQAQHALAAVDPQAAHASAELHDLALALPHLDDEAERRGARALLARPPRNDGGSEPYGAEWTVDEAPGSPHCDRQFCVHWVAAGEDAPAIIDLNTNAVPDYVELVLLYAQVSFQRENEELGWPRPQSDGSRGGDSRTDIYLADICDPKGACIFGYAASDDYGHRCRRGPFRCFAYLVLDNDYSRAEFDYPAPQLPLQVTMAHEYNHVLQYRLDSHQDRWMFESTAVWAEEQVFPDANDWLFYVRRWADRPDRPITDRYASGGLRIYGTALWNHWLERGARYGPGVILTAWEQSQKAEPKHFAVSAFDRAVRRQRGPGFASEFTRFAAATAEWQVADGDFPDETRFPAVRRHGVLRVGRRSNRFRLDHAAYRLMRIRPGRARSVALRVRAPRDTRSGVAIVAREGPRLGGKITKQIKFLPRGGRASVRLRGARRFESVTAVVVNADARVSGFSGIDRKYIRDGQRYRASLRRG